MFKDIAPSHVETAKVDDSMKEDGCHCCELYVAIWIIRYLVGA